VLNFGYICRENGSTWKFLMWHDSFVEEHFLFSFDIINFGFWPVFINFMIFILWETGDRLKFGTQIFN
jgi:hypothetical protein